MEALGLNGDEKYTLKRISQKLFHISISLTINQHYLKKFQEFS